MNYVTLMIPVLSRRQAVWAALGLLAVVAAMAMWLGEKEQSSTEVSGEVAVEVADSTNEPSPSSRYTYFSALAEVGGEVGLYAYAYDWELGQSVAVSPYEGDYAMTALDGNHVLFIGRDSRISDSGVPNFWRLMWGDYLTAERGFINVPDGWNERDVSAHPAGEYIAYAQQPTKVPTESGTGIENWEVVVLNPAQSIKQRIAGAVSPHWVPDTENLVYLKSDGLYMYDTQAQTEQIIYQMSETLSQSADLALSYDGGFAVITHPATALLEVIQIGQGEAGLVYREILDSANVAFHPVFDRLSYNYATVSFGADDHPIINVRDVRNANILKSATLMEFTKPYFTLSDWSPLLMTDVLAESGGEAAHSHSHE